MLGPFGSNDTIQLPPLEWRDEIHGLDSLTDIKKAYCARMCFHRER